MDTPPSILTQLPRAQEAYTTAVKQWADLDTTEVLLGADRIIRDAMAKGFMASGVGGIESIQLAEKTAIQLDKLGYWTNVVPGGQVSKLDGTIQQHWVIQINWKNMPANTRDEHTV